MLTNTFLTWNKDTKLHGIIEPLEFKKYIYHITVYFYTEPNKDTPRYYIDYNNLS